MDKPKKYCYVNKLKLEFDNNTVFEAQVKSGGSYKTIAKKRGEPGQVLIRYKRYFVFRGCEKRLLINGKVFSTIGDKHAR